MEERLIAALNKIAEEIKKIVQKVLEGYDLGDSNLYKDLSVEVADIDLIKVFLNDYVEYIQGGRKKENGKKEGGKGNFPPPEIIAAWYSSIGVQADNDRVIRTCWRIYWHGLKNGVPQKPIFETLEGGWKSGEDSPVAQEISNHWEEFSEIIIEAMTEDLDNEFKN